MAVADDDVAHAGVGVVITRKDGEAGDISGDHIRGQQHAATGPCCTSSGVFLRGRAPRIREIRWGILRVQRSTRRGRFAGDGWCLRAQLTGLHHEGNQTGSQGQEEKWITEPVSEIQYVIMAYW